MNKLYLYFHTLRYLKPIQIYRRFWFIFIKPRVGTQKEPQQRNRPNSFTQPACREPSLIDSETFFFLNQKGNLSKLGWDDNKDIKIKKNNVSKLWRYNQHYFDDLNAFNSLNRSTWHQSLLLDWFENNNPGKGVGWEPYPTSLRIVNWIKWQINGGNLDEICINSLATQARWLVKRLEWHILGNHLFANAKALVYAGLFFDGKEAESWLRKGLEIISNEIHEQVLPDGGNFELSPMYHSIFLEDLLDLINIADSFQNDLIPNKQIEEWREVSRRMLHWLDLMTHPDEGISFFNDAATGIAPHPLELKKYATRLGIIYEKPDKKKYLNCLEDSGYLRVNQNDSIAILDVARIGPDYLPGHAHADTLSFELSIYGKRFFVNSGTSEYGMGPIRVKERSTSSHNTVTINDENSSEVWSGFRVAKRAFPKDLRINEESDFLQVSCSHDGYTRLSGKPIHRRTWLFSEQSLVVKDQIEGHFENAYSYFHLHPSLELIQKDRRTWMVSISENKKVFLHVEIGHTNIIGSYFSPEFGKRFETSCMRVKHEANGSSIKINWS